MAHSIKLKPPNTWRDYIVNLYPDAETSVYCVPPVHLNKVPYNRITVPGTNEPALLLRHPCEKGLSSPSLAGTLRHTNAASTSQGNPEPNALWHTESAEASPVNVQESDLHDDFGQNHVVTNLKALGEKHQEPMFILSQFNFGDYLNQPAYAAASAQLRRPADLDSKQMKFSEGEADVILFHRRFGVMVGEIKSVGRWHSLKKNEVSASCVIKKLKKAFSQLDKSAKVIAYLTNDIAPKLRICKTLFLPYIKADQLCSVLESQPLLLKALSVCLGANSLTEAVELCVCADQLSDPNTYWDVSDDVLSKLATWWRHRMTTVDSPGGEKLYLDIVARFIGPASTVNVRCNIPPRVEVRTADDAVAELGSRLSRLVLTQQQLDILNRDPSRACIHGPPGTGKTVLLVLQSLRWLRQGHDVHVICTFFGNLSVHRLIEYQLKVTLASDRRTATNCGRVLTHLFDFDKDSEVQRAIEFVTATEWPDRVYFVMDEVWFNDRHKIEKIVEALWGLETGGKVKRLHLWCAAVHNTGIHPSLQLETVTLPLRSAPAVIREVTPAMERYPTISGYSNCGLPAPGDGPAPIRLRHSGAGHGGLWSVDCEACGLTVASTLEKLRVGRGQLQWQDVFVITGMFHPVLTEEVLDPQGNVTSLASGVVRGLRSAGVPVCVLGSINKADGKLETRMEEVASGEVNAVTVADFECVRGLERWVVVWLMESPEGDDSKERMFVVSRCTAQLVVVELPRDIRTDDPVLCETETGTVHEKGSQNIPAAGTSTGSFSLDLASSPCPKEGQSRPEGQDMDHVAQLPPKRKLTKSPPSPTPTTSPPSPTPTTSPPSPTPTTSPPSPTPTTSPPSPQLLKND